MQMQKIFNGPSSPRDDKYIQIYNLKITLNGGSLGSWVDEERS